MLDVIGLGKEVGEVLNNAFDQIPNKYERAMNQFFKFLDEYHLESVREDMDHDDLIVWKQRKDDLMNTIIAEIRRK